MTHSDVFQALLQGLATDKAVMIGWEQLQHWPQAAISIFSQVGLLKPANSATAIECNGCHEQCLMPVQVLSGRAFVVCDQRDDMGKIKIDTARLQQWQCSQAQLALWIAQQLNIKTKPVLDKATGIYTLGSMQGKKRLAVLELAFADSLVLRAADHDLPLIEVVDFIDNLPVIDRCAVLDLVDLLPIVEKPERYQPSIARREARKLDTQAMYQSWQKAYRKLKKDKPNRSDVWYSQQIAKMDIAQERDAETIRKNMA